MIEEEDRGLEAALREGVNRNEQRVMGDRTNAGAWRVARLKFDGKNKSEFLDKFPRIPTHWELWDHFAADIKIPEDARQRAIWERADKDAISLLDTELFLMGKLMSLYHDRLSLMRQDFSNKLNRIYQMGIAMILLENGLFQVFYRWINNLRKN